jgi:hypothetical protein
MEDSNLTKKQTRKKQVTRRNIYVKPIDFQLFEWAESQRQSLSEVIALALRDYRKKHDR